MRIQAQLACHTTTTAPVRTMAKTRLGPAAWCTHGSHVISPRIHHRSSEAIPDNGVTNVEYKNLSVDQHKAELPPLPQCVIASYSSTFQLTLFSVHWNRLLVHPGCPLSSPSKSRPRRQSPAKYAQTVPFLNRRLWH